MTPSQLAAALELLAKSEPSEWHPTQVYADQFNALARTLVPDLIAALDLARAALAERDAALERIKAEGCRIGQEREEGVIEWMCLVMRDAHPGRTLPMCPSCIAAACLANRAGDGEGV